MVSSASPRTFIDRKVGPLVDTALADTRVVLITGPRQAIQFHPACRERRRASTWGLYQSGAIASKPM